MPVEERTFALPGPPLVAKVKVGGSGDPLVFFHGASGNAWTPLHDRLAAQFTVYAPWHPGWDSLDDLDHFDSLLDLVLYYVDIFDALGLRAPDCAGHSFGGMVAAEIAAIRPDRVRRLALIAPWGLWRDEEPVADLWGLAPDRVAALLWHDPAGAAAAGHAPGREPEARLQAYLANAAAAHFVWPIPDRRLDRRLHRVTAPTLLVWGRQDGVVPPSYAADFGARLPDSVTCLLDAAAHNVHLEQPDAVAAAIAGHLHAVPSGAPSPSGRP